MEMDFDLIFLGMMFLKRMLLFCLFVILGLCL